MKQNEINTGSDAVSILQSLSKPNSLAITITRNRYLIDSPVFNSNKTAEKRVHKTTPKISTEILRLKAQ